MNKENGDWGLGIGDWGLGMGIGPNPQFPIPNPHKVIKEEEKLEFKVKIKDDYLNN